MSMWTGIERSTSLLTASPFPWCSRTAGRSCRAQAAVDVEDRARGPRAPRRRQPRDGRAHVLGLAEAPQRIRERVVVLTLREVGAVDVRERRAHDPRHDRVGADAVRPVLDGEAA